MDFQLTQPLLSVVPLTSAPSGFLFCRNSATAPALQRAVNVSTGGLLPVFGALSALTAVVDAAAVFAVLDDEEGTVTVLFVSVILLTDT